MKRHDEVMRCDPACIYLYWIKLCNISSVCVCVRSSPLAAIRSLQNINITFWNVVCVCMCVYNSYIHIELWQWRAFSYMLYASSSSSSSYRHHPHASTLACSINNGVVCSSSAHGTTLRAALYHILIIEHNSRSGAGVITLCLCVFLSGLRKTTPQPIKYKNIRHGGVFVLALTDVICV